MLLSADIFEPTVESRIGWDDFDLSKSPYPMSKLLDAGYPSFDFRAPSVPSLSLESLAMVPANISFNEPEDEDDLLLQSMASPVDDMVMEFDAHGQLMRREADLTFASGIPEVQSEYYYANFLSWEDDLFAAALNVPSVPAIQAEVFAVATAEAEESSDSDLSSSDSDLSSSDSESEVEIRPVARRKRTPSGRQIRKRSSPDVQTKSSSAGRSRSPRLRREENKRRRRGSHSNHTEIEISVEILENDSDAETTFCPTPVKGPIGQISKSTHGVPADIIRNIFKAEQVVTLTKTEEDDEEEIDIM